MTRVDCDDCSENFQTKKMYLKHLKSRKCSQSRVRDQVQPDTKKSRDEQVSGLASSGSGAMTAPQLQTARNMEALQAQISTLTPHQKAELQAQITEKQKQVLQAIPYNQLSEKQKEILKRLTSPKLSSSAPQPVAAKGTGGMAPSRVVKLSNKAVNQAQAQPMVAAPAPPFPYSSTMGSGKVGSNQSPSVTINRTKTTAAKSTGNPKVNSAPNSRVTPNSRTAAGSNARGRVYPSKQTPKADPELITEFEFGDDDIAEQEEESPDYEMTDVNPLEESDESNPLEDDDDITTTLEKLDGIRVKKIGKKLSDVANVMAHLVTEKVSCPVCKKYFRLSSLQAHLDMKHKVECPKCPLTFLQEELEAHKINAHKPKKEKCNHCESLVMPEDLSKHIEHAHKVECSKCQEKVLKHNFKDHINTIHEIYVCNECDSRFEIDTSLTSHTLEMHPKEKCLECEALFGTEEQVEVHALKQHPKEYCDEENCDAFFKTVEELNKHKDKIHPKIMKFNGGMFMMMTVDDNNDESDEESEEEETLNVSEATTEGDPVLNEETVSESVSEEVKKPNTGTFLMRFMVEEPDAGVVELDHDKEVMMNTIRRSLDLILEETMSRVTNIII